LFFCLEEGFVPGTICRSGFDVEGTTPKACCYWERGLCFCLLLAETVGIPYCTGKVIQNATGKEGCLPA
jgi:hypothetical protein